MQSAEGEEGGQEVREESSSQTAAGSKLQDGSDTAAEDDEPTVEQCVSQNLSGPEPDDSSPQLHLEPSADDYSPASTDSVQANVAQVPLTLHLPNLDTSQDMEDQEPLPETQEEEEEDEFVVLDSEHPLVRRQQAALNSQLSKQLERINLGLKEKMAMEKEDDNYLQEILFEIYRVQEQLATLQTRLDDRHQAIAQAVGKHQQAQDQLEAMKSQHSCITGQNVQAKTNVSQLQAEVDNLMLNLVFTQGVSESLQSNVKAMKNVRRKAGAEKTQAEEQKLKQDIYVERLTKEMERLTQQIAMYEAQAKAQVEETQAAKEALSEAEMEMQYLEMSRKQLLQQWSSSLVGMRKRDEAFSAMQEAVCTIEHQVILLDREIAGYKRLIAEEQEQNETLTMQLNWSQMDSATSKRLIGQKQAQQEAQQAHYSTSLRTLRETERTLARLSKETSTHQVEVNDQRRQLEKESAVRLELEDKIMTYIQHKLTHNKATKYSQRLTSRIATLKKDKMSQLWQLESAVVEVRLESTEVGQHLDNLAVTQEALDEEIIKYNKLLATNQNKISSFSTLIGQKQATIANYNKKIYEIAASTGTEDLSPLQIKVEALKAQIEEQAANIKSDQQLWMKRQGTLVGLTREIETNSKNLVKLQTEYTGMQQKKIRLESQIELEHREETELEKNAKMLSGDLQKLNTLLSKNGQLSQALEQQNALMETDFLHKLKEAERETVGMQMKHEKTQEEKERLLNSLVEAERQIKLWEKKTQLVRETRSVVDSEVGQRDIQMMKAEIHRMEVRLTQLMKQQERLLRESEATVARRETIVLRREAMVHDSHRQTTKGDLSRVTQALQRKIQDTRKHVVECEQVIRELQESQVSLSDRLAKQKQQLIELCGTSYVLDPEFESLQDTKDRNLAQLVTLQSRTKKLQGVCEGSYQALSTSESVEAALQSHTERVHTTSTILHRVCEEFPEHQGALHRLSLALATHTQSLEQKMS
ncbi:coiled-coil domain-containing protein 40 [Etheostoma cragini]|uniref:coiled-coil domain-containing protein 40 n=1 Tax=Etheostoma cragini TaxID=417921 RepID=UPI00155EF9D3|nr:coiled-coil domain-containing protein 40 [Etheostoma cragini]XP_034744694.1 coiled-coil domain-containing protein 40 [Etheostoma cragini]